MKLLLSIDSLAPRDLDLISILENAEKRTRYDYCVVCKISGDWQMGFRNSLEEHHVAGRANYADTISVCGNCHAFLSDHQKTWLTIDEDESMRVSCYLYGLSDFFDLLFRRTSNTYLDQLASRFRSQGYYLRNKSVRRRASIDV